MKIKNILTSCTIALALFSSGCANKALINPEKAEITPDTRPAKYEPEGERVLMFIGQDNEGVGGTPDFNYGYLNQKRLPHLAGITHYMGMQDSGGDSNGHRIAGLWDYTDWGSGPVCLKCYLDSEIIDWSHTVVHLSIWMGKAGREEFATPVAEGKRDHLIRELAEFINQYPNVAFFIRPGYEFDLQYLNAGISPEVYRSAFRRIVDILREEGATNFATVFSSAHVTGTLFTAKLVNWKTFYPGNDYVDWLGYSVFDDHSVLRSDDAIKFAELVNKPLMIAEASPKGFILGKEKDQKIWDNYFTKLFDHPRKFPDQVKAIAYINTDWTAQPMWAGGGWGDSRLEESEYLTKQWVKELEAPKYITVEDDVYQLIRFNE